jgi:hypothetical protein
LNHVTYLFIGDPLLGERTTPVWLLSHRQALDHRRHHVMPSFYPIKRTAQDNRAAVTTRH